MIEAGYRRIAWGIFFCIFHINLGPVQIFPVFVGYFVICSGIGKLRQEMECKDFAMAGNMAIVCGVLSLAKEILSFAEVGVSETVYWITAAASFTIELLLLYFLFTGSIRQLNCVKRGTFYGNRLCVLMALLTAAIMVYIAGYLVQTSWLLTAAVCIRIAVQIWLIMLMNGLKHEYQTPILCAEEKVTI